MKQVQLKIEEFFGEEVKVVFNWYEKKCRDERLYSICLDIINSRLEALNIHETKYRKNESRETIIEALWEYNKSLIKKFNDEIEKT